MVEMTYKPKYRLECDCETLWFVSVILGGLIGGSLFQTPFATTGGCLIGYVIFRYWHGDVHKNDKVKR